jgi:protein SCO1/2
VLGQAARREGNAARLALLGVLVMGILALGAFMLASNRGLLNPPQPTAIIEGVTAVDPPVPVSDFTLTSQQGQPAGLSSLKGKLSLVYWGYTNCPDFCPATMEIFKRVREALGDRADDVNFVFISVDPARDTPEQIQTYFEQRGVADFVVGMTGTEDDLHRIGLPFGVYFAPNLSESADESGHTMDHNTQTYLLDRDGSIRAIYSFGTAPAVITDNVRQYL